MKSIDSIPEGFSEFVPPPNKNRKTNRFKFFISDDESVILKKVSGLDSDYYIRLRRENNLSNLVKLFEGHEFPEYLQEHIVKGFDIEADGSYKSAFLHGYRLDQLGERIIAPGQKSKIIIQINLLIKKLIQANDAGDLTGDWALHNLIFCLELERIVNVDLEGFVTYSPLPAWVDISEIVMWLKEALNKIS